MENDSENTSGAFDSESSKSCSGGNIVESCCVECESRAIENNVGESLSNYKSDCEQVLEDPEYIGINFNDSLIIDGRVDWPDEKILARLGNQNISLEDISSQKKDGKLKMKAFEEYVDSFHGQIKYSRVHAFASHSPISPSQAVEHSPDGSKINISPSFIEQMNYLKSRCENLTIVVPFYNDKRPEDYRTDVPMGEAEIEDYAAICGDLIDKLGSDTVIEFGNETNVCHQTSKEFNNETRLSFASHVDPVEYAKFYFEAARQIKSKHPEAKLSIAGTAGYDESYLKQVLATIDQLRTDNQIEANLVDVISFHPYGNNPEAGAWSIENGQFVHTEISFKEQLDAMQALANQYGTALNIGEINYPKNDPNQKEKLKQFVTNSSQQRVVAMIWPTDSM